MVVQDPAHLIPEGGYNAIPTVHGEGWVICGDSGGFVNSVHREGSNLAMTTGRFAAETILNLRAEGKDFTAANLHAYRAALVAGLGLADVPLFPAIDERLDSERRAGKRKRLHRLRAESLPDGTMIATEEGEFLALRGGAALLWSPSGYVASRPRPSGSVDALTPPATQAALANGYRPLWHPSSDGRLG